MIDFTFIGELVQVSAIVFEQDEHTTLSEYVAEVEAYRELYDCSIYDAHYAVQGEWLEIVESSAA